MSTERASSIADGVAASGEGRTVGVLVSLLALGLLDNQILGPILPDIAEGVGASESAVGSTASAYAVAAAVAALVLAPLSDTYGRRRFLVGAAVVFALVSIGVASVSTLAGFAVARALVGACGGLISALTVSAIADVVPYERRGAAMGWVGAAYFAAPLVGVPLASWISEASGWRTNYVLFSAAGVLIALALAVWFREAPRRAPKSKPRGGYLRFLTSRSPAAGALSAFFVTGGLTGFLLFLGSFLRSTHGLSATEAGLVYALSGTAGLVGALAAGRLSDRVGKLRLALAGSLALALLPLAVEGAAGVFLYAVLGGVGLAAAARMAPLQSIVTQLVGEDSRASYVALRNTLSQAGNATAAAAGAALFPLGFVYVCWMAAGFSAAAFLLLWLVDEPDAKGDHGA